MCHPFNSSFSFYLISAGMTTISNRRIPFEGMEIEGARILYIKLGSTHDLFLKFSYMKETVIID